jgi:hypothetical protein
MPDGQDIGGILEDTLEDWLKDREGRGEDGEKSGP